MRDAHGKPMNDIRNPSDNRAAADFITATAKAQVTLAEISFVSLRHGLPTALLAGQASFNLDSSVDRLLSSLNRYEN